MTPSARPASELARQLRQSWVSSGGLLLAVGVGCLAYLNRTFQLDDALIYHRYVRNALAGDGLVFNVGERVNALTSPFFAYLSIVTATLVGDIQQASVALCATALLATLVVWWRLFDLNAGRSAATLGALFTFLSPYLWVTFGMETCLFLALLGLSVWLFESDQPYWLGISIALLILTRPEGGLLLIPLTIEHRRLGRPIPSPRIWIAPAAILSAQFLFSWLYYGSPISDTAAAKVAQGRSGLWGPWPPIARVGYHLEWFFGGDLLVVAATGLLAALGIWISRSRSPTRILLLFLVLLSSFYIGFSLPNYHWYYAPFYLTGLYAAGAGLVWLWDRARRIRAPLVQSIATVSVVSLAMWLLIHAGLETAETVRRSRADHPYRSIGDWLADTTPEEAEVAALEIGFLGWYSDRTIIDIAGLVTPRNARSLAAGDYDAWLEVSDPDYIVIHDPVWQLERAAEAALRSGTFRIVDDIEVAGFRLLERRRDSSIGPVRETLETLRSSRDPGLRLSVLTALRAGDLGPTVGFAGSSVVAAHLSPDGWSRGTSPAALAFYNDSDLSQALQLRLTCLASPADLPIEVFWDDGRSIERVTFERPGTREVELSIVPPRSDWLVLVWSERAWQPAGRDKRWLGVHLAPIRTDD